MVTVHLHQLIFHAFHGLYEGEEKIGNDFEVNVDVEYNVKKDKFDSLKHLVNYEEVYKIIQARMVLPTLYWKKWQILSSIRFITGLEMLPGLQSVFIN